MRGLLLKDFYTLTRQMKLFLIMILVFASLPGYSITAIAVVYSAMLPITALAYDERSKWDHLAVMMPYSVRNIVLSKYILGYIAIGVTAAISFMAQLIMTAIKPGIVVTETLFSIVFSSHMVLIMLAVNLPLMFKIGVEKGRMAFILVIAVMIAASMGFVDQFMASLSEFDLTIVLLIIFLAVLIINLISISLSIRFYQKREL